MSKAQERRAARKNQGRYYSYEQLSAAVEELPDDIDILQREQYLSASEFEQVFSMTKHDFSRLREWKKEALKKQVHLF